MNTYEPGSEAEFVYDAGETGLVGTVEYRVDDNQGATVIAATTVDIIELGTTGVYSVTVTVPGTEADWTILWSSDGSFDPDTGAAETFRTVSTPDEAPSIPPLIPISEDGAGQQGPCQAWTSADAMAEQECYAIDGTDPGVLDNSIVAASQLLYPLSNLKYPGTCETTVRPCSDRNVCPGPIGSIWDGRYWIPSHVDHTIKRGCGCRALSRVPLAGHPRTVLEVTIDGEIVDSDTYELQGFWLTRMRHPDDLDTPLFWPSCQNEDVALGEEGTFGVTYEYGFDPPASGIMAAEELAFAIYRTCVSTDPADCPLPQGITRIERQGITFDLERFTGWGLTDGKWQTGLPLVDLFLNAENPDNRRGGRAQVWSPDLWKYPKPAASSVGS